LDDRHQAGQLLLGKVVAGAGAHRVDRILLAGRVGDDDEGRVHAALLHQGKRVDGTQGRRGALAQDDVPWTVLEGKSKRFS
jgi:hypothetical protein